MVFDVERVLGGRKARDRDVTGHAVRLGISVVLARSVDLFHEPHHAGVLVDDLDPVALADLVGADDFVLLVHPPTVSASGNYFMPACLSIPVAARLSASVMSMCCPSI